MTLAMLWVGRVGPTLLQAPTLLRRRARHLPATVAGVDTHGASIVGPRCGWAWGLAGAAKAILG
eukprot:COSAG01_NODE_2087_length_8456_cov_2.656456_5_plen_64_part_00